VISSARAALGDDAAFDPSWAQGCAMISEQAIEFALDESGA